MEQQLYTLSQVARMLNYSTQTVRKFIDEGKLEAMQPGGKTYRISQSAINDFLQKTLVSSGGAKQC